MTIFLQLHFSLPLASTIAQSVKKKKKDFQTNILPGGYQSMLLHYENG
jgi:hypothetical protein